ncbi:Radical SAM domain protein [uncultured Desulfatiglans sp.]|nr:Radical SAM domain protein [uncultured Desulfatiglans sp.]
MPRYVFGPVPSRRLGLSLGIDLLPPKTCSFDCLYCEVGRTTLKLSEPRPLVSVAEVLEEARTILETATTDVVTLAGSGEPTLHSGIGEVIAGLRDLSLEPVVLLTNGSLFWRKEVVHRVLAADVIMPTLCSAYPETFARIHRPHPDITLEKVIRGIRSLRNAYTGRLAMEVVLLAGINDTPQEIEALKDVLDELHADAVYLNTVARPPSDPTARAVAREKLEAVRTFLGESAEMVVSKPLAAGSGKGLSAAEVLIEVIRRRPLRLMDVCSSLGLTKDAAEALIRGFEVKGRIRPREQSGEVYYTSTEDDGR